MKGANDTMTIEGGSAGMDQFRVALTVPAPVAAAEAKVAGIRSELAEANRTLNELIRQSGIDTDRGHGGNVAGVNRAKTVVDKIEERLRIAKAEMVDVRAAWEPRLHRALTPSRRAAGEELDRAAEALDRAVAILGEITSFKVRHGLRDDGISRSLPRARDLRAVAARLQGAAR